MRCSSLGRYDRSVFHDKILVAAPPPTTTEAFFCTLWCATVTACQDITNVSVDISRAIKKWTKVRYQLGAHTAPPLHPLRTVTMGWNACFHKFAVEQRVRSKEYQANKTHTYTILYSFGDNSVTEWETAELVCDPCRRLGFAILHQSLPRCECAPWFRCRCLNKAVFALPSVTLASGTPSALSVSTDCSSSSSISPDLGDARVTVGGPRDLCG